MPWYCYGGATASRHRRVEPAPRRAVELGGKHGSEPLFVYELAPHLLCVDLPARRLRFPPSPPLPPLPAALRSPLLAALQRAEGDMQRNEGCVHVPRNTVAPRPTSASTPSSASAPAPAAPGPAVRLALPNEEELTDDSWRGVAHEVRCACAAAMAPLAEAA